MGVSRCALVLVCANQPFSHCVRLCVLTVGLCIHIHPEIWVTRMITIYYHESTEFCITKDAIVTYYHDNRILYTYGTV